jgi:hypothetical protein
MRPRSETFFVPITAPFRDIYLPKQAALTQRRVQRVVVYTNKENQSDPNTLDGIITAGDVANITITLRDRQDRELMTDAPLWMFGENLGFHSAVPGVKPIMHAQRRLANLPIDPQRSFIRYNATTPPTVNNTVCIEFVYSA